MDPNFSVLLADSNTGTCGSNGKSNIKLILYIVVPIVGAILLIALIIIIIPKYENF